MNRLTGESGVQVDADYNVFKNSVDKNIKANHTPPRTPNQAQKRASSEPGFKQPKAKRPRASSTISAPMVSPLARVAPPPTASYTTSKLPAVVSKRGELVSTVDGDADLPQPEKASSSCTEPVSPVQTVEVGAPADGVSQTHSSYMSEVEDGEIQAEDQLSIVVGPSETLNAFSMPTPSPKQDIRVLKSKVAARANLISCRGDMAITANSTQRVAHDIQASITEVRLASWSDAQSGRVILDVGGTKFVTSKATLRGDPGSLLAAMIQPGSPMHHFRCDDFNAPIYFLDRDPAHFRHILNYLRLGSSWSVHSLPKESRYLYDLRAEAEHYMIKGLAETLDRRIAILSEARVDMSI